MKVIIRKREGGVFDCHIKRTRVTEGNSVRSKGLSKEELHGYLEREIPNVSDVKSRLFPT